MKANSSLFPAEMSFLALQATALEGCNAIFSERKTVSGNIFGAKALSEHKQSISGLLHCVRKDGWHSDGRRKTNVRRPVPARNEAVQKWIVYFQMMPKYNTFGLKSGTSVLKSETSGFKSGTSVLKSETSVLKSETSGFKSETSVLKSETSGFKSETSGFKSGTSGLKSGPDISGVKAGAHALQLFEY